MSSRCHACERPLDEHERRQLRACYNPPHLIINLSDGCTLSGDPAEVRAQIYRHMHTPDRGDTREERI